ncbi:MAG: MCE family protein [Deltaproteobacteria bacterium]|nr:MCE family protein [Deltaproteobacteria bacterium]
MDLNYSRTDKIVGTFVICIAILLLSTVVIIGRGKDWFKKYVTYYTTFEESYNLEVNAAVKLFKTDIGKVKEITLVGNRVKVKLAVFEEFSSRIRSDSYATVESPTLIGSEYVSIRPGSTEFPQIPKGGIIPSKAKRSITDLITEFEVEKTVKMVVGAAQDLSALIRLINDPQGPILKTLDNLKKATAHIERITRDIKDGKGTAGGLVKSRALLESIHYNIDKMGSILDNIDKAAEKSPGAMDQVQDNIASIKKIGDGVTESVARIQKILGDVEEVVATLNIILVNIKKGSEDIPQITQSAKGGILEIREEVDNIDKVVQSLQQNFLIRSNLPPEPEGKNIDAGLRQ